ncbi:pathogenesis-related protein PR-1 [Lactuca sativa]|uniref:pathogenesis-related protein PR-1 n=1 Tax=Lactuca sativa TaxID=4236 RepID=UPI000CB887E0|nr:pathogenesis-related protein PR-1 [Lactuca sativa]
MTPSSLLLFSILLLTSLTSSLSSTPSPTFHQKPNNETVYRTSKQLCIGCTWESLQFLFTQNLVRAAKWEIPLAWDFQLQRYAQWWAGQRKGDCELMHSFPEDDFKLGENIFWGSGSSWSPVDAVNTWAGEEKYYRYGSNTCASGQQCGHYTQIVWKTTRRVGCARVVCDSGDVFMTCNYDPVGNVIGERPY